MNLSFSVPEGFDLAGFIAACRAGGVELETTDAVPNACGFVAVSQGRMVVHLCAESNAKAAVVAKEAISLGARPI